MRRLSPYFRVRTLIVRIRGFRASRRCGVRPGPAGCPRCRSRCRDSRATSIGMAAFSVNSPSSRPDMRPRILSPWQSRESQILRCVETLHFDSLAWTASMVSQRIATGVRVARSCGISRPTIPSLISDLGRDSIAVCAACRVPDARGRSRARSTGACGRYAMSCNVIRLSPLSCSIATIAVASVEHCSGRSSSSCEQYFEAPCGGVADRCVESSLPQLLGYRLMSPGFVNCPKRKDGNTQNNDLGATQLREAESFLT